MKIKMMLSCLLIACAPLQVQQMESGAECAAGELAGATGRALLALQTTVPEDANAWKQWAIDLATKFGVGALGCAAQQLSTQPIVVAPRGLGAMSASGPSPRDAALWVLDHRDEWSH